MPRAALYCIRTNAIRMRAREGAAAVGRAGTVWVACLLSWGFVYCGAMYEAGMGFVGLYVKRGKICEAVYETGIGLWSCI